MIRPLPRKNKRNVNCDLENDAYKKSDGRNMPLKIVLCLLAFMVSFAAAKETKCQRSYSKSRVIIETVFVEGFYECDDGTKLDNVDCGHWTKSFESKKTCPLFLIKEKYIGEKNVKDEKRKRETEAWSKNFEAAKKKARDTRQHELDVFRGKFKDDRDGHVYKTIQIGSQIWMAENIQFKKDSFLWEDALKACPDGWHLPSKAEFEILFIETEGLLPIKDDFFSTAEGKELKGVWSFQRVKKIDVLNWYGFSAKPNIVRAGEKRAAFWSSTPTDSNPDFAYHMFLSSDGKTYFITDNVDLDKLIAPIQKQEKLAVRCVQNNEYAYTIGTLVDSRDGQSYKTVTLGNQTWMAENLNYEHSSGYCYEKNPHNCIKYGRIYKGYGGWGISKYDLCPKGWKIPSVEDFNSLFAFVGGKKIAGAVLKSKSGWPNDGNGLDAYGFSILPAGCVSGVTSNNADETSFWTSGKTGFGNVITVGFSRNPGIGGCEHSSSDKGFSVRCIRASHDNFADNNRQGSEMTAKSVSGNLDLDTVSSQYDTFVDPRDGKSYRIMSFDLSYNIQSNYDSKGEKQINETRTRQTWFAENLDYSTGTSDDKCFNDKHYNCKKYGRFYKWGAAQYACPDGFHLPTESDIRVFQSNVFKNTVKNDAWREYYWLSNGKTYPYQDYSRKKEFNLVRCVKD